MITPSDLVLVAAFSWFLIIAAALAFAMGKLFQGQKELTKQSHLSTLASFYALSEARSFKYSTIIQRISEIYSKPTAPLTPEQQAAQVKAMNSGFEDLLDDATMYGTQLRNARSGPLPKWSKQDSDDDEIYSDDDMATTDAERDLV